jgi:hypothetical protein
MIKWAGPFWCPQCGGELQVAPLLQRIQSHRLCALGCLLLIVGLSGCGQSHDTELTFLKPYLDRHRVMRPLAKV